MRTINLTPSRVQFDEARHQYWLDGKQLQGITGIISKHLFPDEYSDVPAHILEKAAQYGTAVHKSLENFDMFFENDRSQETLDYISICKENGLVHIASEWLVDDGNFASSIDKLYQISDNEVAIADVKTYYGKLSGSKLEKCRWQLSLYRYFMKQMNPKIRVEKLYVIHLRNKQKSDGSFDHVSELIQVDPIPVEYCKELLECEKNGTMFKNPFSIPSEITEKLSRVKYLIEEKTKAEEELNSLKESILTSMQFLDLKNWNADGVKLTRKLASTRSSFDLKSFKAGHPEITDYDRFMKTSNIAESLMVSV